MVIRMGHLRRCGQRRLSSTVCSSRVFQRGQGAPAREPVISSEEQKQLMLYYHRRQEELKVAGPWKAFRRAGSGVFTPWPPSAQGSSGGVASSVGCGEGVLLELPPLLGHGDPVGHPPASSSGSILLGRQGVGVWTRDLSSVC